MNLERLLFALLRAGLYGEPVDAKILDGINADGLSQLYAVSDAHDLAHIVGAALAKCGKLGQDDCSRNFRAKAMLAVSRYERIRYDLQSICDAFQQAQIPFIPLKGTVLRDYYPEAWMRTSCDIDVLVHKEDLETAARVLKETLGYIPHKESLHDVSFHTQSGILIELHFDLIEEGWAGSSCEILKNVWEYATAQEACKYHYVLRDEMFYYYHIAHMAKHFEQGGCGIRLFVDLLILDNMDGVDHSKREALVQKGGLMKFTQAARRLVKAWFEDVPHDPTTQLMEEYVIRGGVYGTMSNRIAAMQRREGGKLQYAFSRIILPYDVIKFVYPVLQKHPWLDPVMQVHRWFKILFSGRTKRSIKELSYNQNISSAQMQQLRKLFKEIGL